MLICQNMNIIALCFNVMIIFAVANAVAVSDCVSYDDTSHMH
jgi:hypothetical protein